jgi:hypothetical protein
LRFLFTIFGGIMREPIGISVPFRIETPEEREIFSAMEQSSVRKETIRSIDKYLSVMEELAAARYEIRELKERIERLEK